METVVGSLAIPGATLAQIMHDFGSVEGDCDGILFGRLQRQTSSVIQDDEAGPAIPREQITARVTGYYCTGRVQSFYDATGRLNQSRVSHIVKERQGRGEDPPIGWFMGRRNSAIWPTMREVAVTSYLRSGVLTATKVEEEDDTEQLISPELQGLHIDSCAVRGVVDATPGTPGDEVNRSKLSLQMSDTQPGSSVVVSSGLEASVSSPSKKSSNVSNPRQVKGVDSAMNATLQTLNPCFFVLFTESNSANNAVRTHEYRAFQSLRNHSGLGFEPLSVKIVNAEHSLREFYESFVPVALIPSWFKFEQNPETSGQERVGRSPTASPRAGSTGGRGISGKSPVSLGNNGRNVRSVYQDVSDSSTESFATGQESFDSIQARIGSLRVSQFENLYQQMLCKLEKLSTDAYASTVTLQQLSRPT